MPRRAFASVLVGFVLVAAVAAQPGTSVARVGLDERALLESLVEAAAVGTTVPGQAWLKWMPHFFRGPEGRTYVAFTLRIDEAPERFKRAAMYVRIAPRGDPGRAQQRTAGVQNAFGIPPGEMPVNSPERRQGSGAPTASDASLMLRSLTAKGAPKYPYEAIYSVSPAAEGRAAVVRRSLALAPGEYDLYIALVEQEPHSGARGRALLKQPITVPNLRTGGLRLSSIVVADRIDTLPSPLGESEQALRPYALGAAELVPADDDQLQRDETLHLAFVIYDAEVDRSGMPDVSVEYHLFHRDEVPERLLGSTPPQTLDRSTLPAGFDLRAGQQLAAAQSLPLASYQPGAYRVVVRVTDNRSGATAEDEVRFLIGS